jgi:cell division protein FtsL
MRDFVTWGAALAFLLTALYAVTVHREVVTLGRSIGTLNQQVEEQERQNENLALELSRLNSPGALSERARELGVVPPDPEAGGTR